MSEMRIRCKIRNAAETRDAILQLKLLSDGGDKSAKSVSKSKRKGFDF